MVTADAMQYPGAPAAWLRAAAVAHATSDFVAAEIRAEFSSADERAVRAYPGVLPATVQIAAAAEACSADRYVLVLSTIEQRQEPPGARRRARRRRRRRCRRHPRGRGKDGWGPRRSPRRWGASTAPASGASATSTIPTSR
ncbi:MAG: hypothetical protein U0W40_20620 [Acidimicrobiia bacterium]